MDGLNYQTDARSITPDTSELRRREFRKGWIKGATETGYGDRTLQTLTWNNLGYRLGCLLKTASEDHINDAYDLCVSIQNEQQDA